jgi:hypothetical protein
MGSGERRPATKSPRTVAAPAAIDAITPAAVARRQKHSMSAGTTNVAAWPALEKTMSAWRYAGGSRFVTSPSAPSPIITPKVRRRSCRTLAAGWMNR